MSWVKEQVAQQHGAIIAAMTRLEVAVERRGTPQVVSLRSRATQPFPDGVRYSLWEATMSLGPPQHWVVLRAVVPGRLVVLGVYDDMEEARTAMKEAVKEARGESTPLSPHKAGG